MDKKALIATYYDEKTIMEYYYNCSIIDSVPNYKNITRNDGKGTCSFFRKGNRYYLNDHSQSKMYGIYDVAMSVYNCDFATALDYIIRDMNIPTNYTREIYDKVAETKQRQYENIEREASNKAFKYKLRSYNNYDKSYWQQFGITLNTLNKFGVRPVETIELFRMSNQKFFEIYQYKNDYQSITYLMPVDGKLRFYTPNEVERKNKWKGNTNNQCVFGFNQLNLSSSSKEIIIASGLKDLMCLTELGFDAIAPMSEPTNLPQHVINALKSSGKRIIYLYDTDLAGLKFGVHYACLNRFEAVWLPKQDKLNLKDVADFMQHFGKDKLKEIIINMLNKTN